MKISLKWLSEYIDIHDYFTKPQELARKLTNAGIEVDSVVDRASDFKHVVVGHIIEKGVHPNADRLTLCKVDAGEGKIRQIVCGAKNHKQGDKVVVALPGAVLPGNFAIKLSKIRDVESEGMLASESELGLSKESEGILILPPEAPVGKSFAEYFGVDDVLFELSVTPNRSDCLSHLGLARELACLLGRPYTKPVPEFPSSNLKTRDEVGVKLVNEKLCPRYTGRLVKNIKVGPSPRWLTQRLEAVDVKPINNVVDITNYVMLELGQPLHAFDVKCIHGGKVIIDSATAGETFTTLDGTKLTLSGNELTIRDSQEAIALAGVVGGKNSGVSESTTAVFVEAAHFSAEGVRRTSRQLGIETDSAYRFSRGTDVEIVPLALSRACELLSELAQGLVAADFIDEYPSAQKPEFIEIALSEVSERLGYKVAVDNFSSWMKRLGCEIKHASQQDVFLILPPSFRSDLSQPVDLIEEYGRLNGYENIPEVLPTLSVAPAPHDQRYLTEERLCQSLKESGWLQAVNYGFLNGVQQHKFLGATDKLRHLGLNCSAHTVALRNPLSVELNTMRVSLLPGLFKNAMDNIRHGHLMGRLYECGSVFAGGTSYDEFLNLGLIGWGQQDSLWLKNAKRFVVYDVKSAIEELLTHLNISSFQWKGLDPGNTPDFLHPKQCAGLFVEGRFLGVLGSLHPQLIAENKMRTTVAVAELDVEKLMRGQPKPVKLKELSTFPAVERDLAFLVPNSVSVGDVLKELVKAGGEILRAVDIFDEFTGPGIPEGYRSVAFRFLCQDSKGTLTEEVLASMQSQWIALAEKKFGLKTR